MKVVLNICRFDPEVDKESYFQKFDVEVEGHQTVLDALLCAREQDSSLSFRRSCRSAICGSCAIWLDFRPVLACHTLIKDVAIAPGSITVEPLPHFRQLKDLVVDLEPLFESLKAIVPWVVTRRDHNGLMAPEKARVMESASTCILCGICDAVMETGGVVKPAAAVKGIRLAVDPRDAVGEARRRLLDLPPELLALFIKRLPPICPKSIRLPDIS